MPLAFKRLPIELTPADPHKNPPSYEGATVTESGPWMHLTCACRHESEHYAPYEFNILECRCGRTYSAWRAWEYAEEAN
jgi:hypothetical protein